jgi:hypothetical protein
MDQDATSERPFLANNLVTKVLAVLLVLAVGAGFYFYQKATADPQKEAVKELHATITAVGKLMVLPTGETPTMATVSDPAKLADQPFFAHAQKGDKVLIYSTAQKAILYSPSLNKIVEVAPVNTGTGASANAPL